MLNTDIISDYFLSKGSMSSKKLQRLLYYAYSWTLALLNESEDDLENKLFDEKFEVWTHGPILPSVYRKNHIYGWAIIQQKQDFRESSIPDNILEILENVWDEYGHMSGIQLDSLVRQEDPWRKAYYSSSKNISDKDIFNYYNSILQ